MKPGLVAPTGNEVLAGSRGSATWSGSGSSHVSCVFARPAMVGGWGRVCCSMHRRQWPGYRPGNVVSPRRPALPAGCPKTQLLGPEHAVVMWHHGNIPWLCVAPGGRRGGRYNLWPAKETDPPYAILPVSWLCLATSCPGPVAVFLLPVGVRVEPSSVCLWGYRAATVCLPASPGAGLEAMRRAAQIYNCKRLD